MEQALLDTTGLGRVQFETYLYGLSLVMGRPFGFVFGFMVFGWAFGRGGVLLRTGLALGLGLPVLWANLEVLILFEDDLGVLTRLGLPTKELLIGFAYGLLTSLPFYGFRAAGALLDAYRGEQSSSFRTPEGEMLQTSSMLFLIVAFITFFFSGGLWVVTVGFYETYAIWPLMGAMPAIADGSLGLFMVLLGDISMLMLTVGLPLLALLAVVEAAVVIGARLARRFQLEAYIFLLKNLVFVLVMPLYVLALERVAREMIKSAPTGLNALRGILG